MVYGPAGGDKHVIRDIEWVGLCSNSASLYNEMKGSKKSNSLAESLHTQRNAATAGKGREEGTEWKWMCVGGVRKERWPEIPYLKYLHLMLITPGTWEWFLSMERKIGQGGSAVAMVQNKQAD